MMKPISVDIYGSKQIRNTENDLPSRPGLFLTDVPVGFQLGWVSLQVEGCNPESQNKIITRWPYVQTLFFGDFLPSIR